MNSEGTVYNAMGRINRLSVLCIDAYGVAVKNGFEGTVEEWLESLKGPKGDKGDPPSYDNIVIAVEEYMASHPVEVHSAAIGYVELPAANWEGSGNLYSQVVDVITEEQVDIAKCQIDLTPDVEQLVVFYEKDLTFVTENEDGVVTVYAIGQKPENDYTIQVTITEVKA